MSNDDIERVNVTREDDVEDTSVTQRAVAFARSGRGTTARAALVASACAAIVARALTTTTTTTNGGERKDLDVSNSLTRRDGGRQWSVEATRAEEDANAAFEDDFGGDRGRSSRRMAHASSMDGWRRGTTHAMRSRGRWIPAVERVVANGANEPGISTTGVTPKRNAGEWIPTTRVADANEEYASEHLVIENYAEMKRRLDREEALREAGVAKGTEATLGFARLGATRADCPEAYIDASDAGGAIPELGGHLPEGFSKFSAHAIRIALMADHIYILCTECSGGIPAAWRGKASYVHGFKIDECLQTKGVNHWLKASFSHAHALMDALKKKYSVVAIVEEDSITRDVAVGEGETQSEIVWRDISQIQQVMDDVPAWQTVRVGYRPMFVDRPWESTSKVLAGEKCPVECACDKITDFACVMRRAGCDMRSSDFYLVKDTSMHSIIESIYNGHTVDCEALKNVQNQVFITPQLSYQSHLDLGLEKQIRYSQSFVDACAV